jgi:transcriptional regulator with XRE-family HTH domain
MAQTPTERTAANVRAEIARRSLTGRRVARDLGWSTSSLHRRLNGTQPFDIAELARLADYLGVSITALIGETAGAA